MAFELKSIRISHLKTKIIKYIILKEKKEITHLATGAKQIRLRWQWRKHPNTVRTLPVRYRRNLLLLLLDLNLDLATRVVVVDQLVLVLKLMLLLLLELVMMVNVVVELLVVDLVLLRCLQRHGADGGLLPFAKFTANETHCH